MYYQDDFERLRKKFLGAENIKENYSQSMQDLFVLTMLNGKKNVQCEGNPYEDWWIDPAVISEETWKPFRTDIGTDSMEVILK